MQSAGRTFSIAMSLLGIVAFAQIGVISWRLFSIQPTGSALAGSPAQSGAVHGISKPKHSPFQAPAEVAKTEDSTQAADAEKLLLASLPRPTPIPVRRLVTPESRVGDLVNLARTLRDRGDTGTALTRLREAQVISPRNMQIISEMAITYEKMGLTDKAIEQWRRIYEAGEKAGIYFAAAEGKLRALQLPEEEPAATPAAVVSGGLPANDASRPILLSLGEVGTVDDTGNSQALRRLKLRVPIVAQPGSQVDVHDVVIQVYFYDQLADGSVVETNANVSSAWASAPVDWSTADPEVLEVEYAQPEPDPKNPRTRERRNYFGYAVRVYYKSELHATRGEPAKLLNQFPPPTILQTSDLPQ